MAKLQKFNSVTAVLNAAANSDAAATVSVFNEEGSRG
jgi:hypothetical protein